MIEASRKLLIDLCEGGNRQEEYGEPRKEQSWFLVLHGPVRMNEKELADAIQRAAQTQEKRVNISLAGVSFLSSGMVTAFLHANKLAKSLGVEVRFVNASPNVIEVFKITKMNRLFEIEGEAE